MVAQRESAGSRSQKDFRARRGDIRAYMAENTGKVIQIAGPAVDVQFSESALPPIYQSIRVVSDGFKVPAPIDIILEVQQHLGEGRVRCVSMQPTDGLVRGMKA